MNTKLALVYTTVGLQLDARSIARTLVQERLAACVNIVSQVESIYEWEGNLERSTEWILLCKTTAERVGELTERLRSLHPYEIPCIWSQSLDTCDPAFLDWAKNHVTPL